MTQKTEHRSRAVPRLCSIGTCPDQPSQTAFLSLRAGVRTSPVDNERMQAGTSIHKIPGRHRETTQRPVSLKIVVKFTSFMVTVNNRKCGKVTCHCRKAQPYRADLSLFLNVLGVTVKSEMTD